MEEIIINFVGICTHLPALGGPGQPHRVVVIQNPQGGTAVGNKPTISPHKASIKIIKGGIIEGKLPEDLAAMTLSIEDDSGNVSYATTWGAIPALSHFADGPSTLNENVAFNGFPPPGISLTYFNVFSGSFLAGWVPSLQAPTVNRRPVGASVTIQTPDDPTMLFSPHDSSLPIQRVTFEPGTILDLVNEAVDDSPDQDSDFLLHFEIVSPIQKFPIVPAKIEFSGLEFLPGERDAHDITTGCSNSAYP